MSTERGANWEDQCARSGCTGWMLFVLRCCCQCYADACVAAAHVDDAGLVCPMQYAQMRPPASATYCSCLANQESSNHHRLLFSHDWCLIGGSIITLCTHACHRLRVCVYYKMHPVVMWNWKTPSTHIHTHTETRKTLSTLVHEHTDTAHTTRICMAETLSFVVARIVRSVHLQTREEQMHTHVHISTEYIQLSILYTCRVNMMYDTAPSRVCEEYTCVQARARIM